jgi:hypothetical protein
MAVMWSALSILFVLALWGMVAFLAREGLTFTVGQWIIYAIWLLWAVWSGAFIWTSLDEGKARAARLGALVFGGISVLSAAALTWLWFV